LVHVDHTFCDKFKSMHGCVEMAAMMRAKATREKWPAQNISSPDTAKRSQQHLGASAMPMKFVQLLEPVPSTIG
jgi:hypothetical protein